MTMLYRAAIMLMRGWIAGSANEICKKSGLTIVIIYFYLQSTVCSVHTSKEYSAIFTSKLKNKSAPSFSKFFNLAGRMTNGSSSAKTTFSFRTTFAALHCDPGKLTGKYAVILHHGFAQLRRLRRRRRTLGLVPLLKING